MNLQNSENWCVSGYRFHKYYLVLFIDHLYSAFCIKFIMDTTMYKNIAAIDLKIYCLNNENLNLN